MCDIVSSQILDMTREDGRVQMGNVFYPSGTIQRTTLFFIVQLFVCLASLSGTTSPEQNDTSSSFTFLLETIFVWRRWGFLVLTFILFRVVTTAAKWLPALLTLSQTEPPGECRSQTLTGS